MNCNTTHYRANSSSVPGDPTASDTELAYLGAVDRFYLLTHVLGRTDMLHYDRVREVELIPQDNLVLCSKGQRLDEPTPTPSGWKLHGDLVPGDEIFGPDGKVCRVVALNAIVTDAECYEIEFDDGTTIQAGAEHQWAVERRTRKRIPMAYKTDGPKRQYRETVLIQTQEIAAYNHQPDNRLAIRITAPLRLPDASLPIDPYLLGCWFGSGNRDAAAITVAKGDFDHYKREIEAAGHAPFIAYERPGCFGLRIDRRDVANICIRGHDKRMVGTYRRMCLACRSERQSGILTERTKSLAERLRQAGMLRGRSKFIPAVYFRASIEQRHALLQGLMDTDGHVDRRGTATFTNINEALIDGVVELANTLGLKPHKRRHVGTSNERPYPFWQVSFQAYRGIPPFRLPRKFARCKDGDRPRPRRYIVACRRVPSVPIRCLQVDRCDGLYLTGRSMVPTHNSTFMALSGTVHEVGNDPNFRAADG